MVYEECWIRVNDVLSLKKFHITFMTITIINNFYKVGNGDVENGE